MQSIITVKNLGKKYNITHQKGRYVALRDVLTNIAKSPFKFAKHKVKKAVGKVSNEEFWALKDINFEVQKGEAIGIIGANGAGKSTLLKILSQITPPTTGEIKIKGSVASLLEVGTGFHPELTGRENIFLNGAILGMTKKEIAEKFDSIVEFAGVQRFIDIPVKRYSSGMYVRLAFAVAAHMEPDILVVDEVLAVGDADFQKKCLGKMDEVMKSYGRTILFVSHNMAAIQNLCKRCILLEEGKIKMIGETDKVINEYINKKYLNLRQLNKSLIENKLLFKKIEIDSSNIYFNDKLGFDIYLNSKQEISNLEIILQIFNSIGSRIITGKVIISKLPTGQHKITITITKPQLSPGNYNLGTVLRLNNYNIFYQTQILFFEIKTQQKEKNFIALGKDLLGTLPPIQYSIQSLD